MSRNAGSIERLHAAINHEEDDRICGFVGALLALNLPEVPG